VRLVSGVGRCRRLDVADALLDERRDLNKSATYRIT
jgi:hypothetical protein